MVKGYVRSFCRFSVFAVTGFSVIMLVLGCLHANSNGDKAGPAKVAAEECPSPQRAVRPFEPTPDPISTP